MELDKARTTLAGQSSTLRPDPRKVSTAAAFNAYVAVLVADLSRIRADDPDAPEEPEEPAAPEPEPRDETGGRDRQQRSGRKRAATKKDGEE
jgi:hypothetical protein